VLLDDSTARFTLQSKPSSCLVHDAHKVVDVLLPVASLATLDEVLPLCVKATYKQ
jgi:hypothetical protein